MNNKIKKILKKKNKSKIVCLTAYSKNIAEIVDDHADIVLVGDSLGSVLYNYDTTRKVSLNMMIEHTKSARMGVKKSLLVIDLPYNTYRNKSEALKNSKRSIKETKCDAVKVEGGTRVKEIVKHLVKNRIPVLGHIGVTPQTTKGKFRSKGKNEGEKRKLLKVDINQGKKELKETENLFESLMGKKAESRFKFIQENANFTDQIDI